MSGAEILLYIPNLIGYFRAACTAGMCITARTHPVLTTWLYCLSAIGDLFDGMAARRFNQTSKFGAILDMAVDRFSQACLLGVLYGLYPNYGYVFLLMIALDLVSHWFQVFSTQYCAESHHKTAVSHFRLLDIYYKTPYVLFVMCFTSEAAMVGLYVIQFQNEISSGFYYLAYVTSVVCVPFLAFKHFINVVQLMNASLKITEHETKLTQSGKKN